jgi:biotin carboxyl carrier protein
LHWPEYTISSFRLDDEWDYGSILPQGIRVGLCWSVYRRNDPNESREALVIRNNRQTRVALFDPFDVDLDAMDDAGGAAIKSPMHGKLVALMVQAGDAVTKGQKVAIVEAMKMEHALVAPRDGVVAEVIGDVGAQVGEGAKVVVLAEG